jgi:hypothetical protein
LSRSALPNAEEALALARRTAVTVRDAEGELLGTFRGLLKTEEPLSEDIDSSGAVDRQTEKQEAASIRGLFHSSIFESERASWSIRHGWSYRAGSARKKTC